MQEAQVDAEEAITDLCVDKLIQDIARGRPSAYTFWLKCKAKDRGFIERRELGGEGAVIVAQVTGPPPASSFDEWVAQNEQERDLLAG